MRRLARDWRTLHGHEVLLAESFVSPARFAGTCYRTTNWIEVGSTLGFGRVCGGSVVVQPVDIVLFIDNDRF